MTDLKSVSEGPVADPAAISAPPSDPPSALVAPRRANLVLATLFLSTFMLGTAELGVVGMLDLIADGLDVPARSAGYLVSAYAAGLALGGPLLAALTIRAPRRVLLVSALAIYLAMTVLAVLVAQFAVFLAARIVMGALHGLFVGIAFTVATSVVTPERAGRAMAVVISGFAMSAALGLPLGALIGDAVGWRFAFGSFVVFGAACLVVLLAVIPTISHDGEAGLSAQARLALAPRVLAVLGLAFLVFVAQYSALTYITPFLHTVTGVSSGLISGFLLAYGVATAVGTVVGGRFADTSASRALIVASIVLTASLALLSVGREVPVLVAVALMVWGLFGFGMVPSFQYRIVSLAGPGKDLAATLPASAMNAGIAVGAVVGGWSLAGNGVASVAVVALVLAAAAVPIAWACSRLRVPADDAAVS